MYQFGPYGPNHATAATFAFRREFLKHSHYENDAALAEERHFLKNYTVPFVQMDSLKTILVFSHIHNSFDKKKLLEQQGSNNPFVKETTKTVEDFVKEPEIIDFFLNKIDVLLDKYEPGRPENKPEVLKQIQEIMEKQKKVQEECNTQQVVPITPEIIKQLQDQGISPELIKQFQTQGFVPINGPPQQNPQIMQQYEARFMEQQNLIQTLIKENVELKDKIMYLEKKIKALISEKITEKKNTMASLS